MTGPRLRAANSMQRPILQSVMRCQYDHVKAGPKQLQSAASDLICSAHLMPTTSDVESFCVTKFLEGRQRENGVQPPDPSSILNSVESVLSTHALKGDPSQRRTHLSKALAASVLRGPVCRRMSVQWPVNDLQSRDEHSKSRRSRSQSCGAPRIGQHPGPYETKPPRRRHRGLHELGQRLYALFSLFQEPHLFMSGKNTS